MFSTLAALWFAASPAGSLARPYEIDRSFTFFGDTTDASIGGDDIDRYSCAADRNESGREVVFALTLAEESDIDVVVDTASSAVDIDVHILNDNLLLAAEAQGCLVRNDKNAGVFHRPAGRYLIVADTFVSSTVGEKPGAFQLFVRVYPTAGLTKKTLAQGVVWSRGSVASGTGFATASWIDIDPSAGARAQVVYNTGCATLSAAAKPANTVAAINAGAFDSAAQCAPTSFLRTNSTTQHLSTGTEHVLGLATNGTVGFGVPQAGMDYVTYPSAVGGRGFFRLQAAGVTVVDDGASGDLVTAPWARSVALQRVDGSLTLAAFDARGSAGDGLTLAQLGTAVATWDRGLAINLDGDRASTLWVLGEPLGGVVNHPSGNDHQGAIAVGSFIAVTGEALTPEPVFTSLPEPSIVLTGSETFQYQPRFAAGAPTLSVQGTTANATVANGVFTFAPDALQAGPFTFSLEACDGHACATQLVTLTVDHVLPEPEPEPTPEKPTPAPVKPEATGPSLPPTTPDDPAPKVTNAPIVSTPKSACSASPADVSWLALAAVVVVRRRARAKH